MQCSAGGGSESTAEPQRPSDLAFNIRSLHLDVTNWQYGWAPESAWDKIFHDQLDEALERGQAGINEFFEYCELHVQRGRDILRDLKFAANVSCNNTPDEIRDLFLQGYDMVISVASEVKFFDVKLDEFAAAVSSSKLTDIRDYTGMRNA